MTSETNSANARVERDMDPLSKGEAGVASAPSPEAQDGGRPDAAPDSGLAETVADGGTLAEPGAGSLEGTAS